MSAWGDGPAASLDVLAQQAGYRDRMSDAAPGTTAPDSADTPEAVTVIVLTEETLKPADVDKIVGLHEGQDASFRVLVPADTERNMLSEFLNHLSLFEMREALE